MYGQRCDERARQAWRRVLPPGIAEEQARWERGRRIVAMQEAGLTLAEIGRREGASRKAVHNVAAEWKRQRHWRAPVERYFAVPALAVFPDRSGRNPPPPFQPASATMRFALMAERLAATMAEPAGVRRMRYRRIDR